MFFSLAQQPDRRFPNQHRFGSWWLNTDNGWSVTANQAKKGYQHDSQFDGNQCAISIEDSCVNIDHDQYRGFPIWWDSATSTLTNLLGTGKAILANQVVNIQDNKLISTKKNVTDLTTPKEYTADQVAARIACDLRDKAQQLAQRDIRPLLFLSGGIDTAILYALFVCTGIKFTIIDYEHVDYDYFTNANLHDIRNKHWAYKQIHHWLAPTWIATGACGDEFLFRGPNAIATWTAWHNIDLSSILPQACGYHVGYFTKPTNLQLFKTMYDQQQHLVRQYPRKVYLLRHILDMVSNDHQHWHLGNTLTWTPFKDLRYTEWILQLSTQDLMDQIIDAKISKLVLRNLYAPAEQMISPTKNLNPRINLNQ